MSARRRGVRTVVAYAMGSAFSERCWAYSASATQSEMARLPRINQMLPYDNPGDLRGGDGPVRGLRSAGPVSTRLDLMLDGLQPT